MSSLKEALSSEVGEGKADDGKLVVMSLVDDGELLSLEDVSGVPGLANPYDKESDVECASCIDELL